MNIEKTLDGFNEYLVKVETDIDQYSIEDIDGILFNLDSWLIHNHKLVMKDIQKFNQLKLRIDLIKDYNESKKNNRNYLATRKLTIVNFTFLFMGFILSYLGMKNIKQIGPNFMMKSNHGEIYLLLILLIVICISIYIFYRKIL